MTGRAFTPADAAVIAALLLLCWVLWNGPDRDLPARAEIVSVSGAVRYPLGEPRRLAVEGPLGESILRFGNGTVAFVSSPCPNKFCVRTGTLRRSGQFAACLPNRVAVHLLPGPADLERREGVDAVGR